MKNSLQNELIMLTSIKSHELWCNNEIKDFYKRLKSTNSSNNYYDRLNRACYKNGVKRNDIIIDDNYMDNDVLEKCFHSYNYFKSLIEKNIIVIKRFVKRDVTLDEGRRLLDNYRDGEENILRDFLELSDASKKETIEGAKSSLRVYISLREAGISIDEMEKDKDIIELIGTAIHLEWLKRNINHPDKSLKVPYKDLDDWAKRQDLNIFYIMLSIIKGNNKYYIENRNKKLPNYMEEEKEILKNER